MLLKLHPTFVSRAISLMKRTFFENILKFSNFSMFWWKTFHGCCPNWVVFSSNYCILRVQKNWLNGFVQNHQKFLCFSSTLIDNIYAGIVETGSFMSNGWFVRKKNIFGSVWFFSLFFGILKQFFGKCCQNCTLGVSENLLSGKVKKS